MHQPIVIKEKQFVRDGRICNLRTSRKCHKCDECGLIIEEKADYYTVEWAHAGLGAIKFPDRVHENCLERYFGK